VHGCSPSATSPGGTASSAGTPAAP
jgi:hypothetical protein